MNQVVKISKQARQKELKDFQLLSEIILNLRNSPQEKILTSDIITLISALADRIERTARNRFITVVNAVKARNQRSTKQFELPESVLFLRSLKPGIVENTDFEKLTEIIETEAIKIKTFKNRSKKAGEKAAQGELTIYENRKKLAELKLNDPERYQEITAVRTKNVNEGQKNFRENMTEEQRQILTSQNSQGGLNRAKNLSPKRRREIAKMGTDARFGRKSDYSKAKE